MTRARENADLPVAMTESGGDIGVGTPAEPSRTLTVAGQSGQWDVNLRLKPTTHATSERCGIEIDDWILASDTAGTDDGGFGVYKPGPAWVMQFDSSGRVTMPNQPMFSVTRPTAGTSLNGDIFSGQTPTQDFTMQGFTFNSSNGRFTCPVAGKYWVGFHTIHWNAGCNIYINKNDVMQFQAYSQNGTQQWRKTSAFAILNLAANDYLNFTNADTAGSHNFHGNHHMRAVAYLIG